MRGKPARGGGAVAKSPLPSLGPGSGPINKYLTQEDGDPRLVETSILLESRIDQDLESDLRARRDEEQQKTAQLPRKMDMKIMFAALENSLKIEMVTIHKDLGHMLSKVEVEKKVDSHSRIIKELKEEIKTLKKDQQEQTYRLEDQEKKRPKEKFKNPWPP